MSSDVERAREFYGSLFGWECSDPNPEFGGYANFSKDGGLTAGLMSWSDGMGFPNVWTVYLTTDDATRTTKDAAGHGGQVVVDAMPVGDLGTMGVVLDAADAYIGLWEPRTHPGFAALAEPGTPGWFELQTRDHGTAVDFYRDVFAWDVHTVDDSPEFRYATLGKDDQARAGIMDASGFLPEGVPSHWAVYWAVEDADATLATIGELGGSTLMPAEDTPYGRLAMAADPMGAPFKLVG
jgi:predicted enzyme related to lactoylglutathione lyase